MKKYLGIASAILITSVFVFLYAMKIGPFNNSSTNKSVEPAASITSEKTDEIDESDEKISVTAMEALLLGYEEAKKHTDEEPLLIHLTSTDDATVPQERNDGADGKRNTWNLSFGSEKGNFSISMKIDNGKVIPQNVRTDDNNLLSKGQYAISDIHIDSPKAVKQAIEELGMRSGDPEIPDDWIKGYHFTIAGYLTDPNSFEKHWLLRVMGISPNSPNSENESLRMSVFFDVKTGEMLNATEMTGYDKDGNSKWRDVEPKH
ncbi:hypothetical protein [Paenibacillus contaminans]|uniref:Uncharacterized protein n=1 Tax=Paenibacillus contaminans TaxID=450362 RepID=A0A329MLQ0_9BACL|nr:hypothetical protein [Paenibacillus contaminans]RAV20799.1 hypothetical protein DQG23_14985 [Paenibacillus contaminans]